MNIEYFRSIKLILNKIKKSSLKHNFKFVNIDEISNNISYFNIFSRKNIPSFNNSAMDGYALNIYNENVIKNKLKILYNTNISDYIEFKNNLLNTVCYIVTGARIPKIFNTVIKIEDTIIKNKHILVNNFYTKGQNVRFIGEDFNLYSLIQKKGDLISLTSITSLASCGIKKIFILKPIQIYYISTGEEINIFSKFNSDNDNIFINNSSKSFIINFLKNIGCNIKYINLIKDKKESFVKVISNLISRNQKCIIITTGAVSKGIADFIPISLKNLKCDFIFHGINIKPGKPILFNIKNNNIYIFSLPGNIISSIIGIRFFLYPLIRFLYGFGIEKPFYGKVIKDFKYRKKDNIKVFLKSFSFFIKNNLYVKILDDQESFKTRSFLKSNSFIMINSNDDIKKNMLIKVFFIKSFLYK
jgi:molybdopterin molybdotransferase